MNLRFVGDAGYEEEGAKELMRLYQTIHTDHEVRSVAFGQNLGP